MTDKTVLMTEKTLQPMLLVIDNGKMKLYPLRGKMRFGRVTANNTTEIPVTAPYVSRAHGEFGREFDGTCYYIDNSRNGTYVNGKMMPLGERIVLQNGDNLCISNGRTDSGAEFVTVIFTTDYPESFTLEKISLDKNVAEINIGRNGKDGVALHDNTVSANHASFFAAQDGWAVIDHRSTNGVFHNNHRIRSPHYLKVGDCVRISNIHFIYTGSALWFQKPKTNAAAAKLGPNTPLNIRIVERSVWQRAKKLMLLQNINMTINSGEMVLILGGSGAGKTTFMNAVMGYEKATGKIMHGATDIYEDFESMKYKIGFVPQQDLLRGSDTVYNTLQNAADMKLPANMPVSAKEAQIEKMLNTLGLKPEKQKLVSKLSGGQRKRLSIAVEYIADPSMFFLDEPDSGLDGVMSRALMENLRTIANENKIVMVISHGPDRAADLFDKVIVLAKSTKDNCGHLAFFGSVEDAFEFFETDSLEGVVRRINRPDEGGDGKADFYIEKYSKTM